MFGRGLSRYVPRPIRPQVVRVLSAVDRAIDDAFAARNLRPKVKPAPLAYRGDRIALIGFINDATGLGRGARLMHASFRRRGLNTEAFDAAPLVARRSKTRPDVLAAIEAFDPTDIVLHLNPPVMRAAVRRLALERVLGASIVGYWAWELDRLPDNWAIDAALCDAIWTPSEFVADAVRTSLPAFQGDIHVEPHDIGSDAFPRASAEDRRRARARLGVSEAAFVAGYSFTMAANFARKNPMAAGRAFSEAFPPGGADATLLLRCPDAADYPAGERQLKDTAARDSRIRILNREEAPLLAFYQALDVYLSLHRSEGYGLQLAEALQVGAQVIATGWSIGDELRTLPGFHAVESALTPVRDPQGVYSGIAGAAWAEPDLAHASRLLAESARLCDDPARIPHR